MVKFQTNGEKGCTTVFASVDTNLSAVKERYVHFSMETNNELYAALLVKHLKEEQSRLIKKAHRDAYEQGYKDGRGKKAKKTWFAYYFCLESPCR